MNNDASKKRILRIVSGCAALLLMGVIFFFSSQPGEDSDEVSTGLLSLLFGQGLDFALLWNALARKVAHMLEFGALAAPVTVFFGTFPLNRAAAFCWPVAFCVLYAITDELHQLFVPGRSCEAADVLVDSIGVLLSVFAVRWLIGRLTRRGQKKNVPAAQAEEGADALVLAAFAAAVTGGPMTERLTDDRAERFLTQSLEQKIVPLTADAALTSGAELSPANRERLKQEAAAQTVGQIRRTDIFLRAYRAMRQAGAEPLCVKGAVCRAFYPKPDLRISADEDLLVREGDFECCADVLRGMGFVATGPGDDYEVSFRHRASGCMIELHRSLFPEDGGVYSRFNALLGDLFRDTESVSVNGTPVLCPGADAHFLYMVLHAFKHFLIAGVGVRQLADLALFAQNHAINWKQIFDQCASVRLVGFLNVALCIGAQYFGLAPESVSDPRFDPSVDTGPLLRDVMDGGVYGSRNADDRRSGNLTFKRYAAAITEKRGTLLSALFPPKETIRRRYPFAANHAVLLPAAYLLRLFRYVFSRHDASRTFSGAALRSDLMRRYGIF